MYTDLHKNLAILVSDLNGNLTLQSDQTLCLTFIVHQRKYYRDEYHPHSLKDTYENFKPWLAINYTNGVLTDEELADIIVDDSVYDYSEETEDMDEIVKDDYGEVDCVEEAYDNDHVDYSNGDQRLYVMTVTIVDLTIYHLFELIIVLSIQMNQQTLMSLQINSCLNTLQLE